MSNHAWTRVLILSLCLSTNLAKADSTSETFNSPPDSASNKSIQDLNLPRYPTGWRLFGGVGTGYGAIHGNEFAQGPDGSSLLLGLHLSYQIRKWEFETGADWMYSSVSGATSENLPVSIRTRSGFFSLSPRYRITDHWQLGPVYNFAFGTDTGFAPQVGGTSMASFLDLKGAYEFTIQNFPIQFWAQLSSDVSIPDRQAVLALTGIQIGFPFSRSQEDSETIRYSQAAALPMSDYSNELRITLDPQKVFFKTDSAELREGVKTTLAKLGSYLKENPEQIERLVVSGHADQRGAYAYNLKLSKKRSESVRQAMLGSGMSPRKIQTHALNFMKPADSNQSKKAWAKNRRVEIVFHKVLRVAPLIEILKPLMKEEPNPRS